MTPHPQAHLLRAIADGKQIQIKRSSEWRNCDASTALTRLASVAPHHIRIKPDTVTINGIEPLATRKAAKLYSEAQFEQACRAIVRCATDALRGEMEAA